jgi:DNA-binding IclR family transcriptional regulator
MATKTDRSFGSLEKAIRILSLFDSEHPELSAQEISETLNTPLSTTYNYLKVFLKHQILSRDEHTNKFHLGFKIFKLGVLAAQHMSLLEIARPYLISIAARSRETVTLTVIDGLDILCVDTIESSRPVRFTMKRGGKLPLHVGAPGKALLAHTDQISLEDIIRSGRSARNTENGSRTLEQLESEMETIRRQGYSRSDSEVAPGFSALAVPILDHRGLAAASLSIIGSTDGLVKENQEAWVHMLTDAAQGISERLGYPRKHVPRPFQNPRVME